MFDVQQVREVCATSHSFLECLPRLGLSYSARNRAKLREFASQNDVSLQHFVNANHRKRSPKGTNYPSFICPVCQSVVPEKAHKTKFCSQTCAAIFNNKKYPKRKPNPPLCTCGNPKSRGAIKCQKCRNIETEAFFASRSLKEVSCQGNARIKYSQVRKHAIKVLCEEGRPKICQICGFDVVVEVHHIQPISDFQETDLISEINHPNNLLYLCPNHHAMFERNLLTWGKLVDNE